MAALQSCLDKMEDLSLHFGNAEGQDKAFIYLVMVALPQSLRRGFSLLHVPQAVYFNLGRSLPVTVL